MHSATQAENQGKDTNLQEYLRSELEAEETYKAMMEKDVPEIWDEINRRLDAAASGQAEDAGQAKASGQAEDAGQEEDAAQNREQTGENRIHLVSNNPEQTTERTRKMKNNEKKGQPRKNFWKKAFFGTSLRTAAAVFAIFVLGMGAFSTLGGISQMSSSYEHFSFNDTSTANGSAGSSSYSRKAAAGSAAREEAAEADADYAVIDEEMPLADAEEVYEGGNAAVPNDTGSSLGTLSQNADINPDPASSAQDEASQPSDSEQDKTTRKLIRNISMSAETKEFDQLIESLKKQVEEAGGYIESSSFSGSSYDDYDMSRRANFTLRIPSAKTDAFLAQVRGESNVTSSSENTEDITLTYVDMQSHVKALREEQSQLLKLMEKAESMEDLLAIRSQLTDIRYELESYESQLKTYDNLVDYDTISLSISEVKEITPPAPRTIWQKMGDGFMKGLKGAAEGIINFLIMIVSNLPYFVILFVIIFGITALVRKLLKHRRAKKAEKEEKAEKSGEEE